MLTRSLDKAKEAFKKKDPEAMRRAHSLGITRDVKALEEHKSGQGQFIKSIIYGGLDGIVTTFAVVAGVAGADLAASVVLIMGFANLIADGLSMAIGDFISTRSENEYNAAERKREEWEVRHYPEGEKIELRELYEDKGLAPEDAEKIVDIISRNHKAWVDIMMVEELGIIEETDSPLKNAVATFLSFVTFGFIPILAFVLTRIFPSIRIPAFPTACVLTGLTLFTLGAFKVKITDKNWFLSGIEMLVVGSIAAAAAYGIGVLLGGLLRTV